MRHIITALFIIFITAPVSAAEVIPGPIVATPYTDEVGARYDHDGDTFKAHVSIWLGQTLSAKIRLDGIDTPEMRGKCQYEINLALKARDLLWELLHQGRVELWRIQYGKWAGRVLAHVTVDGESVPDILISKGLARPYDGGKRQGWCG